MYEGKDRKNFERCHEYCDGNIAIFYCPQCWTNYCQECYDKEHTLKKRKEAHDKIHKTRETCSKHNFTLEYKSNETFACCMCIKDMSAKELSSSMIEPIDSVATLMKAQLEDKMIEIATVSHKIQTKLKLCNDSVNKSISDAKNEVQRFFKALNILLLRQETSFQQQLNNLLQQALTKPCLSQMKELMNECSEVSDEARSLLNGDSVVIAKDFKAISERLNKILNKEMVFEVPTLNVSVNVHRHLLEIAKHPGFILSNGLKDDKNQELCSLKTEHETNDDISPCSLPCSSLSNESMVNFIPSFSSSTSSPVSLPCDLNLRPLAANSIEDEDLCSCPDHENTTDHRTTPSSSRKKIPRKTPSSVSLKRKQGDMENTYFLTRYRKTRRQETSKDLCRCDALLTKLWASDDSFPFVRAVDVKKVPKYYEIIDKPMDLSMIKQNLQTLTYDCVYDFVADMKLMFSNCFKFNVQGSDIYVKGRKLEKIFINLMRKEFPDIQYKAS